ncbi:MAG: sigma-70 family RNA polymerase sigma factor [Acidobacteriota bacterium]|nr:sigma-70 family RNA polymerase sigma factor [Acidobacteriota bacterium]
MQTRRVIAMPAQYWPESTLLPRIVARAVFAFRLGREDAADLLQDVRVAVLDESPVEILSAGWIFLVAHNKAVDILRARYRERAIAEGLPSDASYFEEEIVCLVRAQVSLLPAEQREFYELRYRRGMTEREVAERLGICRASVRYRDRLVRRTLGESVAPKAAKRQTAEKGAVTDRGNCAPRENKAVRTFRRAS